jgi:hypothetical protein
MAQIMDWNMWAGDEKDGSHLLTFVHTSYSYTYLTALFHAFPFF